MSLIHDEAPGGPPVETARQKITERRELRGDQAGALRSWTVDEFDDGEHFMLTAQTLGTSFSVHFTAEQWSAFQGLVLPAIDR